MLRIYFCPSYAPADTPRLSRLAITATEVAKLKNTELIAPPPFKVEFLQGLHCDQYIDAFMQGKEPLASSQGIAWTPNIRDATLAMLSGQLEGAKHALKHGIAMNLARGFHHAVRNRGTAYCPLNGLALVAHHFPDKRIVVLDCDEHGGNGTEEFAAEIPNLFNISIFGTRFGCLGGVRSWAMKVLTREQGFDVYQSALIAAQELILDLRPDLIIYQAGADCHYADPKSRSGLTTEEMYERDRYVFQFAKSRRVPILFVVAGGYQKAVDVARLNLNTVNAALKLFFNEALE